MSAVDYWALRATYQSDDQMARQLFDQVCQLKREIALLQSMLDLKDELHLRAGRRVAELEVEQERRTGIDRRNNKG